MILNSGTGEDSWESLGQPGDQTSQSSRKSTPNIHWKDWCWSWSFNTLATWFIGQDPDTRKDRRQEEKGMTEDKMIGWHHWFNGHKFEQTMGDCEGQGSLVYCSSWGPQRVKHDWVSEQQKILRHWDMKKKKTLRYGLYFMAAEPIQFYYRYQLC